MTSQSPCSQGAHGLLREQRSSDNGGEGTEEEDILQITMHSLSSAMKLIFQEILC